MKGGARPGAGRKPVPDVDKRKRITITLPHWLIEWLKGRRNQGRMIEEALKEKYNLKSREDGKYGD